MEGRVFWRHISIDVDIRACIGGYMHYGYANPLYCRDNAIPMSIDTSPSSTEPAGKPVAPLGFLDLSEEALDGLIRRVEQVSMPWRSAPMIVNCCSVR